VPVCAGPSGKPLPCELVGNSSTGVWTVRWSASELGVHTVDVQYGQLAVLGSPFACKVFDVSKVVILYDQLHDDESGDVVFYGPSISVTFFYSRDLRSFEIRFEFESAVPIRFDSGGPIRKFSNRPCLPIARSSQATQTINGA